MTCAHAMERLICICHTANLPSRHSTEIGAREVQPFRFNGQAKHHYHEAVRLGPVLCNPCRPYNRSQDTSMPSGHFMYDTIVWPVMQLGVARKSWRVGSMLRSYVLGSNDHIPLSSPTFITQFYHPKTIDDNVRSSFSVLRMTPPRPPQSRGCFQRHSAAGFARKKLERLVPKLGAKSGPTFRPPRSRSHLNSSSTARPGGSKNGPTFELRGFNFFATWVSIFVCFWGPKM